MTAAGASGAHRVSLTGKLRAGVRLLAIFASLALALPLHFLARLFTRHSPFPRLFLALFARLAGVRISHVGTPLARQAFYVANHVSWLDIPALAGASGTAFVAKAEVAKYPLIGWLCRLHHTVFVRREARLDIAAQINALEEALADAPAIAVFPEGTTTDGLSLLPFKSAMLKVLEPPPPGILVQPVLLDYGPLAPFIGWVGDEAGLDNALKILGRPGSFPLKVHFLEPFSPEQFPGRKAIAAEARARIAAALEESLGAPTRPFALDVAAVRYVAPGGEAHDRADG
ncbi:1-acyl-sn-glycerol-3-phosphate acyltransferase [Novosphingobium flavum]|uniref:1-acyl-sn-glycerol-3-phosphate acyltransferase n=1 Tax=Novosphingobium flavum TaxID=1778672 RepID=A0A7X1FUW6_9SPHN|nr:lysophospholipid acyltransferase family protein [Novosphingobium flavum]MBC2667416.1 1-acyl-sn-glycerol-3-phosphate acyltransferase [Novosphingobium flavum]